MSITRVRAITSVRLNEPDDLFICASSFEERCTQVCAKLVPSGYQVRDSIIFNYFGGRRQTLRLFNRTKMLDYLRQVTLADHVNQVACQRNDPRDGVTKMESILREHGTGSDRAVVTIDITTFTKQYLLKLLQAVEHLLSPQRVRLLYTDPWHYGRSGSERLTFGVERVVTVPGFEGTADEESAGRVLVVLLGYELHRTIAAIERCEADLLIAGVGRPPFYEGWDEVSIRAHECLLARPDVVTIEIPTRDPDAVAARLEGVWSKYHGAYPDFSISPTGTKLQTVGIYLFARRHPEVRVLYAIPKGYMESYYSIGCGETWEYALPT